MSDSTRTDYSTLVQTLRGLGAALGPAVEVQHDAPVGGAAKGPGLVPNPTSDIVFDPRRMALSDEIEKTSVAIRKATALLYPHINTLTNATRRWEGES